MEMQQVTFVSVPFISAIIAGKWAMELGFSQIGKGDGDEQRYELGLKKVKPLRTSVGNP